MAITFDVASGNTTLLGSSVSTANLTWANKPTAGTKIVVVTWAWQSGGGGADNITSIVDNSTGGNITLTKVVTIANGVIRIYIHFGDNVQPPAGSYVLAYTFSASQTKLEGTGCSYAGVATGVASATKTATGNSATEATGSFGSGSDGLGIGGCFNDTGTNGAPTIGGAFTIRGTESNGAANVVGGMADDIGAGAYSPSFSTTGTGNWAAVGASWAAAAVAAAMPLMGRRRDPWGPARVWMAVR